MCGPGTPPSASRTCSPPNRATSQARTAAGIVTAILTALVGSALPGPGTSIRATSVQIKGRAADRRRHDGAARRAGETARTKGSSCSTASAPTRRASVVATAILEVLAPTTRQQREVAEHRLDGLLERCHDLKPMLTGVVHPCSAEALAGAVEAAEAGLIVPVLFGPEAEIRRIADQAHLDIAKYPDRGDRRPGGLGAARPPWPPAPARSRR